LPFSLETTSRASGPRISPRVHPQSGKPSEVKVKEVSPEASQLDSQVIQYREVDAIFGTSLIEGSTSGERAIYVSETRKAIYPMV